MHIESADKANERAMGNAERHWDTCLHAISYLHEAKNELWTNGTSSKSWELVVAPDCAVSMPIKAQGKLLQEEDVVLE
jgi:hypothetical protein